MRKFGIIVLLLAGIGTIPVAAQSPSPQPLLIVDQLVAGMAVTTQGCVQLSERSNAYFFTNLMTWPVVRKPEGPYGPRHLAIRLGDQRIDEFIGDTLQLTGHIVDVKKSEVEMEPGLHQYGSFVEVERRDANILLRPQAIGLALDRHAQRPDIPISLLEYQVDGMMRVMRGCLTAPRLVDQVARHR